MVTSGFACAGLPGAFGLPCAKAAPPADVDNAYEPYGVHTHLPWTWIYKTDAEVIKALTMMRDAGIQWARMGARWQNVEPRRGKYSQEQVQRFDLIVKEAGRIGIRIALLMNGTPKWASLEPATKDFQAYAPRDPADWERYVNFLVRRYSGPISYWEIRNEIDLPLFWKSGLPAYVDNLKRASRVIKDANPSNRVILAGLAGDGVNPDGKKSEPNVLQRIYDLGAAPYFDVVAIHCYYRPTGAQSRRIPVEKLKTARQVMERNNDHAKPLWMNELGLHSLAGPDGPAISDNQLADEIVQVYPALLELPFVAKVFWYNFRCMGTDPNDQARQRGLVRFDMTPRTLYEAYRRMPKYREIPRRAR